MLVICVLEFSGGCRVRDEGVELVAKVERSILEQKMESYRENVARNHRTR